MSAPLRIGTSGFGYREGIGSWHEPETGIEELLTAYSRRLSVVEIAGLRRRPPPAAAAERWARSVDGSFRFCLVAGPAILGNLRTTRSRRSLGELGASLEALGQRAGPLLLQWPATLSADLSGLDGCLRAFAGTRLAVELRHPSWRTHATLRLLSRHGAALAVSNEAGAGDCPEITADFVYWRFRSFRLNEAQLIWAERAAHLSARGVEVFAFIRPRGGWHAAQAAEDFAGRVDERGASLARFLAVH